MSTSSSLIEISQIRVLLKIVEMRSFSQAAIALGTTQPSVSQQVKRIEAMFGRPLFRRRKTGVELNSDGEAVVVYARAMLSLDKSLRSQLTRNAGRCKVTIGMSQDLCRTALPSVLRLFARHHPDVEVRVVSGSYETLATAIEARTVDLAVLQRNTRIADLRTLWIDRLTWAGPRGLSLPVADPVPLIAPLDFNPCRQIAIQALNAAGRSWRIVLESDDLASIEAALQAGVGVTAFPLGMQLHGAVRLDAASGLPTLPVIEFAMREPAPEADPKIRALAAVIRGAAAVGFDRAAPADPGPAPAEPVLLREAT